MLLIFKKKRQAKMSGIETSKKQYNQRLEDSSGKSHIIEIIGLNKHFGEVHVIKDITFYIRENEFLTLLGPSGCGKSTTLRMIAGFEEPDNGQIIFEGENLLGIPAYQRKVNTVFQRYALFPHLNVFDNIAFGLKLKKKSKQEVHEKVMQSLKTVDLEGYSDRWVDQLSGGQMQRVAIARAIVNEPEVLLLDEPLGALDLKMRKEMQVELKDMQRRLGITFVYVTHDQEEALTMSDTIIVMKEGVIHQIGTPTDIYNEPKDAFVADFIGESNILCGSMKKDFEVSFCEKTFLCVDPRPAYSSGDAGDVGVDVVIRPEDIVFVPPGDKPINGKVTSVLFKGVHYEMLVETILSDGTNYEWMVHSTDPINEGDFTGLSFDPDEIHIMKKSEYSPDRKGLSWESDEIFETENENY